MVSEATPSTSEAPDPAPQRAVGGKNADAEEPSTLFPRTQHTREKAIALPSIFFIIALLGLFEKQVSVLFSFVLFALAGLALKRGLDSHSLEVELRHAKAELHSQRAAPAVNDVRPSVERALEEGSPESIAVARIQRLEDENRELETSRNTLSQAYAKLVKRFERTLAGVRTLHAERLELRRQQQWNKTLIELLESTSITKDEGVWWPDFVDRDGNRVGRKGSTHILVLGVPRARRAGKLWVRFPREGEPDFFVSSSSLQVSVEIRRNSDGNFLITVTDLSRHESDSKRAESFMASDGDGVAFVMEEYIAGVFRQDLLTAYKDVLQASVIIGRALPMADYFQPLRWKSAVSKLRGGTLVLPPGHGLTSPALLQAAAQFRERQRAAVEEGGTK